MNEIYQFSTTPEFFAGMMTAIAFEEMIRNAVKTYMRRQMSIEEEQTT